VSARGLRPATGGTGKFAGAIDWIEWGAPFELLPTSGPYTRSSTTSIAGRDLVTSCTLSNFTFGIISPGAYRPGDWSGDALDDLYNIGGTDLSNELVNAISGEVDLVTLDFACSATLGGEPFALDGVNLRRRRAVQRHGVRRRHHSVQCDVAGHRARADTRLYVGGPRDADRRPRDEHAAPRRGRLGLPVGTGGHRVRRRGDQRHDRA
jgi:hypothetical protein